MNSAGRRISKSSGFLSWFRRSRGMWKGKEAHERYGDRGIFRSLWFDWKESVMVLGCVFSFFVSTLHSNEANHILENIELNRQQYYGRQFGPEYCLGAPSGIYDGATGYSYEDDVSGLRMNADNRLVTNQTTKELKERVEERGRSNISSDMVSKAEALYRSPKYQQPTQ